MKLIINADDAGYSETRDSGILELANQGFVTDVSVMVNGENFEHFLGKWKSSGHTIPGIHVNVTEGSPILQLDAVPSLVNADGFMFGKDEFLVRLSAGSIDLREAEAEVEAQVAGFVAVAGETPSHYDGHQHIHVMPGVAEVCARVLSKHGVRRTRCPDEEITDLDAPYAEFLQKISTMARDAKLIFQKHDVRFPAAFVGLTTMGSAMTLERLHGLFSAVATSGGGACELMVHPGRCCLPQERGCGCGVDSFSRLPDREHEMRLLTSGGFKELLQNLQLSPASFAESLP